MSSDTIANALKKVASFTPSNLLPALEKFKDLYDQRLWHQLTQRVQEFYEIKESQPALPFLYNEFILLWWKKMSPLVFVKLAVATARALRSDEAVAVLEDVENKLKDSKEVEVPSLIAFASLEAVSYKLRAGDLSSAKATIQKCAPLVEMFASIDGAISATYFRTCLTFDKANSAFSAYFKDTLMYLSCVPDLKAIPLLELHEMSHDLCIAALLGDAIYNFGEVLNHPILEALQGTPVAFLRDILLAFNAGDHDAVQKLLPSINQHPALSAKLEFLNQKLCLMSLVECVFRQLKVSRQLPLKMIAEAARVPLEQAEFLLMKALSLKLIRGSIHEVDGSFQIEWVQPRCLDLTQIAQLKEGIQAWRKRIDTTSSSITTLLPPAITAIAADH